MAVRTKQELLDAVRARLGDDTSDETIAFVEDFNDTINDYENKANNDNINWKEKYEQNDKEWRTKYRERFFSGTDPQEDDEPEDKPKKMTYEELFKEV